MTPLAFRLNLRRAEALSRQIIRAHGLPVRNVKTLPAFLMAEAFDLRNSVLRRHTRQKRSACSKMRARWADRCDADPALER
ncbi:MAG: hypothetical protein WA989_05285, partial [Henriciella sp.]|uniref:hypothetical protein n=1 Tax=Henriciella sp. TaxID=1968823 RepID=UPI003C739C6D